MYGLNLENNGVIETQKILHDHSTKMDQKANPDRGNALQDVFNMPQEQWKLQGDYQPWYVGWANYCDKRASDILKEYYEVPSFLPEDGREWIFMGTPGFGADFHVDDLPYTTWQAQVNTAGYFE